VGLRAGSAGEAEDDMAGAVVRGGVIHRIVKKALSSESLLWERLNGPRKHSRHPRGGARTAMSAAHRRVRTLGRSGLAAWRIELSELSGKNICTAHISQPRPSRLPHHTAHSAHTGHAFPSNTQSFRSALCPLAQTRRRNGAVHPDRDQCGLCALQGKGQEAAEERHPGRGHCVCRGHRQRIEAQEVCRNCCACVV
jgi:hypothetical protein